MSYLGRHILGDSIPLSLDSVTPALVPTTPDSTPVAKIYDASGSAVETVSLGSKDLTKKLFDKSHFLGSSYSAGRYMILYQWIISAVTYHSTESFDILTGGDADGHALSLEGFDIGLAEHLLYQTESGKLVSGRNPAL
tara:strand:+ start:17148 stop:17561 length:414 start_codon:yes stop_codon:yes gene_type:complete